MGLRHGRPAFVTEAPDEPSFGARARGFREVAAAEGLGPERIAFDPERPGANFERTTASWRSGRGGI